ncbi:MAG: hypothetical protein ACX94B_14680 [Henriciella sp.]
MGDQTESKSVQLQVSSIEIHPLKKRLLFAASAGMMALAVPSLGLYGSRAWAQAVPVECDDTNPSDPTNPNVGNGIADAGEFLTCVSDPANDAFGPINTTANDLTIVIGDENPGTVVDPILGSDRVIYMTGAGNQTLEISTSATVSRSVAPASPLIEVLGDNGNISIRNNGDISLGSYGSALTNDIALKVSLSPAEPGSIEIDSPGSILGAVDIDSNSNGIIDVSIADLQSSAAANAIDIEARVSVNRVAVEVGTVRTLTDAAVDIYNNGRTYGGGISAGDTELRITGSVTSQNGQGVYMFGGGGTSDLKIDGNGDVTAETNAIEIKQYGTGRTQVTIDAITSTSGAGLNITHAGREVNVQTGEINSAGDGIYLDHRGSGGVFVRNTYGIRSSGDDAVEITTEHATTTQSDYVQIVLDHGIGRAEVIGQEDGVEVRQDGTGDVGLTLYGDIHLEGTMGDGVVINGNGVGAAVDIRGYGSASAYSTGGDTSILATIRGGQ